MVTLDELRKARYQQPFQPFILRLQDGRTIPINDWAAIGYPPNTVLIIKEDATTVIIDQSQVKAIEYLIPVS